MAAPLVPQMNSLNHAGEYGNACIKTALVNFLATVVGTYNVIKIPAGTKVYGLRALNEALGASTTLAWGYAPVDSTLGPAASAAYFGAAAATASAGDRRMGFKPVTFEYDVYLTVTLAGATTSADVDVDVVLEYEYVGK